MRESQGLDIALVGPAHPYRGGIAHFIEKMHHGLTQRGHRVGIFTFKRQYPELVFPGKTQLSTDSSSHVIPAIRSIDTLNPLSWFKTARLILDRSPDVVIFKYWMPFFAPAFGYIARKIRKSGTRVIVVVDNVLPHERRPGDVVLTRYFLSAADGFVVMSRKVGEDLKRLALHAPTKMVDHPTYDNFGTAIPIRTARGTLKLPLDAPVLLFFGFVRRYKGLHILLSAMPEIVREIPTTRLIIAGEFYDDEEEYVKQIADLQLTDHVTLLSDYIPDEEVATVFSAADVVVQPYLSATQSGVAQIAFNFDRPLITTDVGGLAETVVDGSTGLVVEPKSPSAVAHAVIRFFREKLIEAIEELQSRVTR
jgi:glycosyltransferase involved in cell wall biosynthesis